MHIALILRADPNAFPGPDSMAWRLAPLMELLAASGHAISLVHGRSIDPKPLAARIGNAKSVPAKNTSDPDTSLPSPMQERAAAMARGLLRTATRGIAGMDPPAGRVPPRSLADLAGAGLSDDFPRSPVVNQCLELGADVVMGMAPVVGLDVLLLPQPCAVASDFASLNTAASVLAIGHPCWRSVRGLAACQAMAESLLPPDPRYFSPEMSASGSALRERLGIRPDEMVVLAVPCAFGTGRVAAVRAFSEMASNAAGIREKLRLILPTDTSRDSRAAIAEADRLGITGRTLTLRALSPSGGDSGGKDTSAPWHEICAAANVGLALSTDPNGITVLEAVASGCPVVALSTNAAAGLLLPGACGEQVSVAASPADAAVAAATLLATERAQRSRQFVAMAGHFPAPASVASLLEGLAAGTASRKLLALCDVPVRTDPMKALVAGARRHSAESARTVGATHPPVRWSPVVPPPADRWVTMATAVTMAPEESVKSLPGIAGLEIPGGIWVPDPDQIVRQDDDTLDASWRLPGGGARERLYGSARPAALHARVWYRDADAGDRAFAVMRHLSANGVPCATAVASGSDGRRSFLLAADAPGTGLREFLRSCAAPDTDPGRMVRGSVFAGLGRLMADLHGLGFTAVHPEAADIRVALGLDGTAVLAFAWPTEAVQPAGGVTIDAGLHDLAWLALSLGADRLLRPRHRRAHVPESPANTADKPSAAAAGDVARAIGIRQPAPASGDGPQPGRPRTAWPADPEGVTASALMRALRAYAARRGMAGSAPELAERLLPMLPGAARRRTEWLERRRKASDAIARERVARGELVPVKAGEI